VSRNIFYLYIFRFLTFQYDGIVSNYSSPQPPLQIPPLALPKGRPGQDVRLFFEREIVVIYLSNHRACLQTTRASISHYLIIRRPIHTHSNEQPIASTLYRYVFIKFWSYLEFLSPVVGLHTICCVYRWDQGCEEIYTHWISREVIQGIKVNKISKCLKSIFFLME
jgi:hypothetical protein